MASAADPVLETVDVPIADGTFVPLHIARPAAGATTQPAGLLVFQDAFGYNSHLRGLARRFSDAGFTAVVPELYHRSGSAVGAEYDNPQSYEANRPHMRALSADAMLLDARAAYGWLVTSGAIPPERVAAIGWCMGGRLAFITNAHVPLAAAISMYGGGIAPAFLDQAPMQHGRILTIWGGADTFLPVAERRAVADALRAAQKPHDDMVFSDAQHGFFSPYAYHEHAATLAWSMSIAFLRATGVLVPR